MAMILLALGQCFKDKAALTSMRRVAIMAAQDQWKLVGSRRPFLDY